MSGSRARTKRSNTSSPPSLLDICDGLFECYNFLTNNEYSDKTVGLLAFILRKVVGDINFSDIFIEYEKRNQQGHPVDFVTLLQDKRKNLSEIDASIEKCLMLDRLITYIQEDATRFMSLICSIQEDMRIRMIDDHVNQMINYPEDFRQREKDFKKRKDAQNMRRLFYYTPIEAKAPNLIYLQNRTMEHLSYLIDCKMRYEPTFRKTGLEELINIFTNSFMIIAQPHAGVNPVLTYERKGPGIYTAKVSVIIVSLLHDFMETHPNMIELFDFEPILCPPSDLYKLDKSQKLSWKICQLQISPGEKPRKIQYAKLSLITIKQRSSTNTPLHIGEGLHTFNFPITLRLNLTEYKISKTYNIPLESLPFAISSHTNRIPHLLTKVIIDDIRRFSQLPSIDIKIMLNFLLRYFIHRTGVEPKQNLRIYLEEELTKAKDEKKNYQSWEDIFMDFLVQFVHQVEFMAKHPILAMFYADGLYLGPCNSVRTAEIIEQSSDVNLPIVGLRSNSIKVDYKPNASTTASSKIMKLTPCAVRVIIYNTRTKILQNRTFNSSALLMDICRFVLTANADKASYIRILSNFDDKTNSKVCKSYKDFTKYYHNRLHEIFKTDPNYKPITNLLVDIEDTGVNQHINGTQDNSRTTIINHEHDSNRTGVSIPYVQSSANEIPLPNVLSQSNSQPFPLFNDQDVIQYVLFHPHIFTELLRQFRNLQVSLQQQQQQQSYSSQSRIDYSNQQISFPSSIPVQIHQQYHSQLPSMQYLLHQPSSSIIPNQQINGDVHQQLSAFPSNSIQESFQQHQIQTQTFQTPENDLIQSIPTPDDSNIIDQITNGDNQQYFDEIFIAWNDQQ